MVTFRLADVSTLTGIKPGRLRHILAQPVFEGVDGRQRGGWRRFTARDALGAYVIRLLRMRGMTVARARRLLDESLRHRFGPPSATFAEMSETMSGVLIVTNNGAVNVGLAARSLMARARDCA